MLRLGRRFFNGSSLKTRVLSRTNAAAAFRLLADSGGALILQAA